ncbi:FAD-dependent oxidoreductase [Maricaulis sp.]|uniref:NAD(P)/FAD-dependent oxidoreductase n=1 Tax=Maricaulis sp. TaxID=1486257 RepID=UPI002613F4EC|nr:FAD-dependent oxidoreductase [Maricaulis sp.]
MTHSTRKSVAVIGSGISGLSAAWRLSETHDVTVFEKDGRLGGHANTQHVQIDGADVAVDTGFIVYNPKNYPNFTPMLEQLGVESAQSDMSFAASIDDGDFEYSSNSHGLFAQKRNLLRPRMWMMISDLLRLYRAAQDGSLTKDPRSLDEFLREEGYSDIFRNDHILPMCAAIWSSPAVQMKQYPARTFFEFFRNHGLVQLRDRPMWRTVRGGSQNYVKPLSEAIKGEIHCEADIQRIDRTVDGVLVYLAGEEPMRFDEVVLACHSDQALALLSDADGQEREILGSIAYKPNTAVLHTDTRLMPKRRGAWASWNYIETRGGAGQSEISLTYWMNALQPLNTEKPVLVTLNPDRAPAPETVLKTETYAHPVFDEAAIVAQHRMPEIQGRGGIWYCGAWMGSGFHEDGLQAGLAVAEALGAPIRPWGLAGSTSRIPWPNHVGNKPVFERPQTLGVAAQ